MTARIVIAVVNSSQDTVEMLRLYLQQRGFASIVTAHVDEIKRGQAGLLEFVSHHDPTVVIYDVAIPYEENWKFLQMLMSLEPMRGRKFVITTTNKRALESLVGPNDAIEIVGKPYDLEQIVQAVDKAAAGAARSGDA